MAFVSIYHMIKEDKDFEPIDYDKVVHQKKSKATTLDNVIEFLGEHGIDNVTIELVKRQCSRTVEEENTQKTGKQPSSDTEKTDQEKTAEKRTRKPRTSKGSASVNNTSPETASA